MDVRNLIQLKIDHNAWATRRIIDSARPLPLAELERDMGIGPGSLRATLAHLIGAMYFFAGNFDKGSVALPTDFEARAKTLDGLVSLLDDASERLARALHGFLPGATETTQVPWPTAKRGQVPAFVALAQVFDHGTHHRAQCKNMLKRLGVRSLPDIDPLSYGSES